MAIWLNSTRYTVTTVNALGQTVHVAPGETVDSNEDLSIFGFTLSGNAVFQKKIIDDKIVFEAAVVGDAEGDGSFVLPYTDDFLGRTFQRIVMLPDEDDADPPDDFRLKVTNNDDVQYYSVPKLDSDSDTISIAHGPHAIVPQGGTITLSEVYEDLTFTLNGIGVGKKVTIRIIMY